MRTVLIVIFNFLLLYNARAIDIVEKPLLKFFTPNSILEQKQLYIPAPVGKRTRYATCTSAAWFHGHYLALANLYGNNIRIYDFNEQTYTLQLIQEILDPERLHFHRPEHIAISPDETLLLVANSDPASINLYALLPDHTINSQPLYMIKTTELIHNVRFAPDDIHCACTRFNKRKAICIYALEHHPRKGILLRETRHYPNPYHLEAKAITFTKNGHFVIVAYSLAIIDSINESFQNRLTVYAFDQVRGALGEQICTIDGTFSTEDISLSSDQTLLFASDQAHDQLIIYPFNPNTGLIDPNYTRYTNPDAQLSFPHGLSISHDGNYLAVSNYGDDSCTIYALNNTHNLD